MNVTFVCKKCRKKLDNITNIDMCSDGKDYIGGFCEDCKDWVYARVVLKSSPSDNPHKPQSAIDGYTDYSRTERGKQELEDLGFRKKAD